MVWDLRFGIYCLGSGVLGVRACFFFSRVRSWGSELYKVEFLLKDDSSMILSKYSR